MTYRRLLILLCVVLTMCLSDRMQARDRSPQAKFDVPAIEPEPGSHVNESTSIKATLHYTIDSFEGQPIAYSANLLFDNPMGASGKTSYFVDLGCAGTSQDLTAASGTITLECHLREVWSKFRHSKQMGVSFVIVRHRGANGAPIARSESVHYVIDR